MARQLLVTIAQIVFFIAIARLSDALVDWLDLPVPGAIVGILLLFALLKLNVVKLRWIDRGADWLLAEMLLFFIPAAVGVIQYKSLVAHSGLRMVTVILVSTVAVMACAGWIGERIAARHRRNAAC